MCEALKGTFSNIDLWPSLLYYLWLGLNPKVFGSILTVLLYNYINYLIVATFTVNSKFVVDAKLAFGHAAQVAFHYNFAGHVSAQHLTLR